MSDLGVTGLQEWIVDLEKAAIRAPREVIGVMHHGAMNIKDDWRRRWSGHAHIPALPYAVGYDLEMSFGGYKAVIGPDKDRPQGPLGNLVEYGSIHNAPIPGGQPALDAEAPRFEKALADLAEKLLNG